MSEPLTRAQLLEHLTNTAGEYDPVIVEHDAALRQEIERLTAIEQNYSQIGFEHAATVLSLRKAHGKTVQDLQSQLAQAEQERDRLQHTVEEQRATITYLEGLRHE